MPLLQLHRNGYSTEKSVVELVRRPIVGKLARKKNWNKEHSVSLLRKKVVYVHENVDMKTVYYTCMFWVTLYVLYM